eukprot:7160244-Pyramimonas_sp.AAC.1
MSSAVKGSADATGLLPFDDGAIRMFEVCVDDLQTLVPVMQSDAANAPALDHAVLGVREKELETEGEHVSRARQRWSSRGTC